MIFQDFINSGKSAIIPRIIFIHIIYIIHFQKNSQAGAGGFEPPIYSLGGCRLIRTRPRALFRLSV